MPACFRLRSCWAPAPPRRRRRRAAAPWPPPRRCTHAQTCHTRAAGRTSRARSRTPRGRVWRRSDAACAPARPFCRAALRPESGSAAPHRPPQLPRAARRACIHLRASAAPPPPRARWRCRRGTRCGGEAQRSLVSREKSVESFRCTLWSWHSRPDEGPLAACACAHDAPRAAPSRFPRWMPAGSQHARARGAGVCGTGHSRICCSPRDRVKAASARCSLAAAPMPKGL